MKKHWTQTEKGRARMREIALANDNLAKARLAKANGAALRQEQVKQNETAFSMYNWKIVVMDNEIRIIRK